MRSTDPMYVSGRLSLILRTETTPAFLSLISSYYIPQSTNGFYFNNVPKILGKTHEQSSAIHHLLSDYCSPVLLYRGYYLERVKSDNVSAMRLVRMALHVDFVMLAKTPLGVITST